MKGISEGMKMYIDECKLNEMYANIQKIEDDWIEEYNSKTGIQKFIYNTKLNIDILTTKNMKLKDKLFHVIHGA
jgi:hypothetical protein